MGAFDDVIPPGGSKEQRDRYEKAFGRSNDRKDNADKKRKPNKFDPIVSKGKVRIKKAGPLRKLSSIFIANDPMTIRENVFNNIFVPSIQDMLYDMVTGGLSMLFYDRPVAARRGRKSGFYHEAYEDRKLGKVTRITENSGLTERSRVSKRIDELEFDDIGEAEEVREKIFAILDDYEVVSVADVMDLCNEEHEYTENDWGWDDLSGLKVRRLGRGVYTLVFPKAKRL